MKRRRNIKTQRQQRFCQIQQSRTAIQMRHCRIIQAVRYLQAPLVQLLSPSLSYWFWLRVLSYIVRESVEPSVSKKGRRQSMAGNYSQAEQACHPPNQKITTLVNHETMSTYNEKYMREALAVAQEAYDNLEVPVGCVFVSSSGQILAKGRNRPNETYNASNQCRFLYSIMKIVLLNCHTGNKACRN